MKKVLGIIVVLLVMTVASTALTVTYVTRVRDQQGVKRVDFGLMNSISNSTAYNAGITFDRGSIAFYGVTGTATRTFQLQVAHKLIDEMGGNYDPTFTNATAVHTLTPGDTDTYKFDFQLRSGDFARIKCVSGCDVTNTVTDVYGTFWRVGSIYK